METQTARLSGLALSLLGAILLLPSAAVEADPSGDAHLAPVGCWTMEGGSPSRCGATRTPGVRGPLTAAWSVELGDDGDRIASEPRVWHDRVYVEVASGTRRELHVLSLRDGRSLAKPASFDTVHPLELAVEEGGVLVRADLQTLERHTLERGRLKRVWRAETEQAFHSPMIASGFVVALDGEDVVAWQLGADEPAWRLKSRYRGRLAASGGDLFVLESDDIGNLDLVRIPVKYGAPVASVFVGHYGGRSPPATGDLVQLMILDKDIFIFHSGKVGKTNARLGWVSAPDSFTLVSNGIYDYRRLPVAAGPNVLVTEEDEKQGQTLSLVREHEEKAGEFYGYDLAHTGRHEAFARSALPYSVAGGMAYVGQRAFDWTSRHVHWIGGPDPLLRPVPAHEALLVVPEPRRLTCLRAAGEHATARAFVGAAARIGVDPPPEPLQSSGAVLFIDESAHEGAFELAPDGSGIVTIESRGKREKRETHAIEDVTLVVDEEGRVLYTIALDGLERTVRHWVFLRRADDYHDLAKDAYGAADPALLLQMIAEAQARGTSDKRLASLRKKYRGLVDRPRPRKDRRAEKVLAELEAIRTEDAARVQGALASLLDDPRWEIQRIAVREALEQQPKHARATELIRARIPAFLDVPKDFSPIEWLDLVDELEHTDLTRVERPKGESPDLTRVQREYGHALVTWRDDLIALQAKDMVVITPLARPGRIAGCLNMASIVYEALESVFQSGQEVRTNPWPMILRLYETKEEYLAASGDSERMEWTAGHYDSQAGVARIFLPERRDAWREVMSTYAHELTHQWIDERCPLYKDSEGKRLAGIPGYWIVEGMATFVEEFKWNLAERTWETRNPAANSLDVVANATPDQLIPWATLYDISVLKFWRMSRKADRKVPIRWRLGYSHEVSQWRMFYEQSAATCSYLYHADEELRGKLLEYVRAFYTGSLPPDQDSIADIFGMTPDELGKRVVAYAQEMNATR